MKKPQKIKSFIQRIPGSERKGNWKVVLLCVMTATTFWFFNALNKSNYSTRINYPVQFNYNRDSLVEVTNLPSKVQLYVVGGGWEIFRRTFWLSNVTPLFIDLENPVDQKFITSTTLYTVLTDQLSNLQLSHVIDDTIFVNIEPRIQKRLSVSVDSANISLKSSYKVTSPVVISPDSITFEGPRSMIEALGQQVLVNIPYTNIDDENFNEDILLRDQLDELIKGDPEKVEVHFETREFVESEKVVSISPINFPEDSSIYLDKQEVKLYFTIKREDMEKLNSTTLNVVANLNHLNKYDSTVMLRVVQSPRVIYNVATDTASIKVVYKDQ